MGVFDFVKDAGAKVGIGESTEEAAAREAAERKAALDAAAEKAVEKTAAVQKRIKERASAAKQAERMENFEEAKKAVGLEGHVTRMGLDVKNLDVRFDDGVAKITGEVPDQATLERVVLSVGNCEGVETVEEELTVVSPSAQSRLHAVAPGDTLWALATTYLGDGNRYPEIFEANKPMLSDPNKIFVGQVLRIPAT